MTSHAHTADRLPPAVLQLIELLAQQAANDYLRAPPKPQQAAAAEHTERPTFPPSTEAA